MKANGVECGWAAGRRLFTDGQTSGNLELRRTGAGSSQQVKEMNLFVSTYATTYTATDASRGHNLFVILT